MPSEDLSCSVNSHKETELQVRGGPDWKSQLQTPPPVRLLGSALTLSPVTPLHRDSRVPGHSKEKSGCLGLEVLRGRSLRKLNKYPGPRFAHFLDILIPFENKGHAVRKGDVWTSIGLFILPAGLPGKADWIRYTDHSTQFSTQIPKA